MSEALNDDAIAEALAGLSGWQREGDALTRAYRFSGFPEAISFITRIAFDAERLGHHPEIQNVYSKVDIRLTTHDAGNRITSLDVELARAIDAIAWV